MDTQSQNKWNNIYQQSQVGEGEPVWVLKEFSHLLPVNGKALDIACGLAPNGVHLARLGLQVEAWDISDVVVEKINQYAEANKLKLVGKTVDFSSAGIPESSFDVIVVSHYLERSLAPVIVKALRPGGLLFYQTFVKDVTPSYSGPSNPDFRLDANELLKLFSDLKLVAYREEATIGVLDEGLRNVAAYIGQKDSASTMS